MYIVQVDVGCGSWADMYISDDKNACLRTARLYRLDRPEYIIRVVKYLT